jgi:hypothetical protein
MVDEICLWEGSVEREGGCGKEGLGKHEVENGNSYRKENEDGNRRIGQWGKGNLNHDHWDDVDVVLRWYAQLFRSSVSSPKTKPLTE